MAKMKAIEAAVRVLEKEGVTVAFGVPGAAINPLYAAMKDHGGIGHILARHVEGARAELDSLVSAFAQQLSIDVSGMDAESAIAAVHAGLEDLSDKQLTLSAEDGITPVAGSAKSAGIISA